MPADVEEMDKRAQEAAAFADAIIEREIFLPEMLKAAAARGMEMPKTPEQMQSVLQTAVYIARAKRAQAEGRYPGLQRALPAADAFQAVASMAKRSFEGLEATVEREPSVSAELYQAAANYYGLRDQVSAAQPSA